MRVWLGFVKIVRAIVGRHQDIEHAIDAVAVALLHTDQTFVRILQQRERCLDIAERWMCIEDFHDRVILDTREQAGDILVSSGIHDFKLARGPVWGNQGFYQLAVGSSRHPDVICGYNPLSSDNNRRRCNGYTEIYLDGSREYRRHPYSRTAARW